MPNINITEREEFDDKYLANSLEICEMLKNAGDALRTLNVHENTHNISNERNGSSIDR